jgi:dTDP-glucose 4,6-dehydratase
VQRKNDIRILVTGGAGFIGSNLVWYLREQRPDWHVVNFDALTYAGNLENLAGIDEDGYTFVYGDVRDRQTLQGALEGCTHVVHMAAESHVDRSIEDSSPFITTNVQGTQNLLDACREVSSVERVVIVSTDEVYGSLPIEATDERFTEESPLQPSSPYAASKTAADLLALAHHTTFGTPVMITRCSNNFGPYQYPEKVIPLFVTNLMEGEKVPLYGDGRNVRDWIHVVDHCEAVLAVLERGEPGEVYNIGADNERSNLELTHAILEAMGQSTEMITHVADRLGHDLRYAIDATKMRRELGWQATRSAWPEALAETVAWYRANEPWWRRLREPADETATATA